MKKVFVGGSRNYYSYQNFRREFQQFLLDNNAFPCIVLSGGAWGADTLAERFATDNNLEIIVKKADWETHGKSAGVKRTKEIFEDYKPDLAFLVWDGVSKGTNHTRKIAASYNVPTRIYYFTKKIKLCSTQPRPSTTSQRVTPQSYPSRYTSVPTLIQALLDASPQNSSPSAKEYRN